MRYPIDKCLQVVNSFKGEITCHFKEDRCIFKGSKGALELSVQEVRHKDNDTQRLTRRIKGKCLP
jgi:hypothetical protein